MNEWRAKQGFRAYTKNVKLCDIAKIRLVEIRDDWSHDDFVPTVRRNMSQSTYDIGENLAKDMYSEQAALIGWVNSPTHLKNLEKSYKYSCIETDGRYVVQMFGNL